MSEFVSGRTVMIENSQESSVGFPSYDATMVAK